MTITIGDISRAILIAQYPRHPGNNLTYTFYQTLPSWYATVNIPTALQGPNGEKPAFSTIFDPILAGEGERAITQAAFAMFGTVIAATFTETTNATATFGIAAVNFDTPHAGAWASQGSNSTTGGDAGDIWLTASARDSQNGSVLGTAAHQDYIHSTLPHEIGHALGLSHTHHPVLGPGTPLTGLLAIEDSTRFSIMSYNQHPTENHAVYELQLYDIAALQRLYGIDTTATAGATTYNRFHENNPGDGTVQDRVFAIWDGQGIDTIDASNALYGSSLGDSGSLIDLRPGYFSSIGLDSHLNIVNGAIQAPGDENVSIAFGAYIENATGGADDDALIGNLLSNVLIGGEGNDLIYGEGRLRPDQLQIPFGNYDGDYRQIGATGIGAVGTEAQASVSDPTHQKDKLFGGEGDDQLWGGRGDDELWGGTGSDLLYGWGGDDTVVYGRETETGPETAVEIIVAGMSGTGTDARITANANAPDANVKTQLSVTQSGDVDMLVDIEAITLTDLSDTIHLTGDLNAFDSGDVTIDMRSAPTPVAHHHDIVDASDATAGVYINLGNGSVRGLDLDGDLDREDWEQDVGAILLGQDELRIVNGNEVVGTQYSDFLVASWGAQGSGEGYSALHGEQGNDLLVAGGWESHLYGGAGDDQFIVGAGAWIEDGQTGDQVTWLGHQIYGGVNQWWMTGNTAFWSPFSSIASAFVSVGTIVITAVAALVDVPLMKFAAFQKTHEGDLVIYLAWGHGGKAVIQNYELDLRTGSGTAGVTVFQSSLGWMGNFSLEKFTEYVNLALMAGFGRCLEGYDPLVLDLDGDGFELIGERVSQVYLEFDADGFAERTGWVHKDDALLSIDLNANGTIDGLAELFGNETTSGFAMLSAYDLNLDGVINAFDAVYANLRVWRDLDQDGLSDAGELQTLGEAGIASISLASTEPGEPIEIGGNGIARVGTFTRTDGSTSGMADVVFGINETATRWMGDGTVSGAAAALPELMGFGEVKNLRVAMTGDAALLDMVDDFAAETSNDLATLKAGAEAILYRWAGVDGVAADALGTNGFNARKLAFLELYSGYELMPRDINGDVLTTNIAEMEALWADQVTRLTLRLVVQGPMADAFDGIGYRADLDMLVADTPTALADLYAGLLDDLPSDPGEALAQWQGWAPLLGAMADGMTRSSGAVVRGDYIAVQLYAAMDGIDQPLDFAALAGALGLDNLRIGSAAGETLARGTAEGTAIYLGEGGTDILEGGTGQDVYVFGRDIGHVTIDDEEGKQAGDRLRFAFHTADEVTLARDGNDLLITVTATGETVRVTGQFAPVTPLGPDTFLSSNKGIEEIEFGDGELFEIPEIMTAVGTGSDGDDDMAGTMHSDVLIGGLGDDLLEGGDDADLYVVHAGDGHDVIREVQTTVLLRAADMVIFGDGIAADDLVFTRLGAGGDDLLITIGAAGQTLLIEDQFAYTSLGYDYMFAPNSRIEAFGFSNYGEGWGIRELQQKIIADATTAGDDETLGFGDNDWFGASAGDDLLIGMDGQDVYQWGAGAGNDVIDEQSRYIDINVGLGGLSLSLEADTVLFAAGIVQAGITFSRPTADADLVVTIVSTGETLTVTGQFAGFQTGPLGAQWFDRIEWFQFDDGSRLSWQDVLADITTGGDGNDSLWGDLYEDRLEGGHGNDFLSGKGYADTYVFGLGDDEDVIADDNASILDEGFVTLDTDPDILELGAGIGENDISFEREGADVTLVIGAGGDRVTLQDQDDYFHTGVFGAIAVDRIEEIHFDAGAVWTWQQLNGRIIAAATTAGNDTIQGFMMADRFEASAGDDLLAGGDSGDTYVFGPASGHDVIQEGVSNVLYGDFDSVEFGATVLPGDVAFSRAGSDLIVTLAGGATLTIDGQFDYQAFYTWTDVELFRFAGGTEWTKADVQAMMLTATSGNDHLIGFSSEDLLDGGAGNDILEGGDGSDIYHFGLGGGSDIIRESHSNTNIGEYDRVVFGAGVLVSDVDFARDEDDLVATIVSTGQTLTIEGHFNFSNWYAWNDIEQFSFAGGTNLSDLEVAALILGGTPGDDHLIGTFRSDLLDGGAGNDVLEGGDGADRYVFGLGYGDDEIVESLSNANLSEDDQLEFGAGIALEDLGFARDGDDLVITVLGTSDSLRVTDQFAYSNWYTWWDVDRFVFADGTMLAKEEVQQIILAPTAGSDHLLGFMTGDTLDGGAGNDILEGGDGADTYVFGLGYGQDEIVEVMHNANLSENDTLRFGPGVEWEDLLFSRSGDTLVIAIAGTTDTLTIDYEWTTINDTSTQTWWDVENFVLADGTARTKTDVQIAILESLSTDGNDTLTGFYTADTLDGGLGNDLLDGGRGGDTFIHNIGDGHDTIADYVNYWGSGGDRLLLGAGIATADVIVRRSDTDADDMVLSILGGQSSVTLRNQNTGGQPWTLDLVEFADGTIWTKEQLANLMTAGAATPGDDVIDGTAGADEIFGGGGNDILRGLGGNDRLDGGSGNDRLEGADGSDVYVYLPGGGADVVSDYVNFWGSWDIIELGAGVAPADLVVTRSAVDTADMVLTFTGVSGSITIDNQFANDDWGIDQVKFADGTILSVLDLNARYIAGVVTSGNDTIDGTYYADTIAGLGGNDLIRGNGGNDRLDGGAGDDRLEGSYDNDTYVYALGGGADVVSQLGWWGAFDIVELGAGLALADLAVGRSGTNMVLTFAGVAGSLTIEGQFIDGNRAIDEARFAGGSVLTATDLNTRYLTAVSTSAADTIDGCYMAETITGLGGDDLIRGNGGNDRLDGGAGNDRLEGSWDNDTYVYGLGGGDDVISQPGWWGSFDVLELGTGIAPADVSFRANPSDLSDVILVFAGGGSVLIDNQLAENVGVDEVRFANGTVWNAATLLAEYAARQGTAGDDYIGGTGNGETLNGGAGNDTIRAQAGNDTLNGGDGDDILLPETGVDIVNGGAGFDIVDVSAHTAAMTIDLALASNQANLGAAGTESWSDVEGVIAGSGNDIVYGTAGANTLSGRNGTDSLYGRDGNDVLIGGTGDDTLDGGLGDDVFQIGAGDGSDYISGGDGNDTIVATAAGVAIAYRVPTSIEAISGGGFANVTIAGTSAANVFDFSAMTLTGIARIDGFGGNDTLTGSAGADVLAGGAGDDTLTGGGGDDVFLCLGSDGWDYLYGGDGYDTVAAGAANVAISLRPLSSIEAIDGGGFANVTLSFGSGADTFDFSAIAMSGIARIDGWGGNDTLTGSAGADALAGGTGDDTLNGGGGDDNFLYGTNDGYDHVAGGDGVDTIVATATNAWIGLRSLASVEAISAGGYSGVALWGSTSADTLNFSSVTLTGIVKIDGYGGNDTLTGSAAADTIAGGAGDDTLDGGGGDDLFQYSASGDGYDHVTGGSGTDTIIATGTNAWIGLRSLTSIEAIGAGGYSGVTIWGSTSADTLNFSAVTLTGIVKIDGYDGNDTLTGSAGADTVVGGSGNDTIAGGAGNDSIDGGSGTDTVDYSAESSAWTINLATGSASAGAETDTLTAIENATGGSDADTIGGTSAANVLTGGAGNDRITGGAGNDTIQGGLDTDVAVFAGLQASYSINTVGGSIQIVDNQTSTDGNDGTDTLSGVEVAEFKNGVQVGLSAPIVLDLDGDGVELVRSELSQARFDWDGDGVADRTGWIGRGDGILVYDRDGDGTVSNAREMSFLDDKPGARSDLDGLSAFDSNGDGLFSAGDQAWADFRIWMDGDLDGRVDAGEFVSMAGAGVASISLAGMATNQSWDWGDNIVVNHGGFTRTDGSVSQLADVAFSYAPSGAAAGATDDIHKLLRSTELVLPNEASAGAPADWTGVDRAVFAGIAAAGDESGLLGLQLHDSWRLLITDSPTLF